MTNIIWKKREGLELSPEEITFFINAMGKEEIPDYQVAALLMAIYFQGMNKEETLALTKAMMHSGDIIDLSAIAGIKVDKHSTGGVGDKTTIILEPLVASAGARVAKMTGRGMGHTGGTLDKLRSFRGLNLELTRDEFIENVNRMGIAISGQSARLVPADKKLYALRDVTATVDNISLIAASIMSKKLASGSDAIVLDVKAGKGAFMKSPDDAFRLAELLVSIGEGMNRKTLAVISNMEQPLGRAVGNALEVKEAIATLKGRGPADLLELCLELGSQMLILTQISKSEEEAKAILKEKLRSGAALEKLAEFIENQGGDPRQLDDTSTLPQAKYTLELKSPESGFVSGLDAFTVGRSSMLLGAGRKTIDDPIDLAAGVYLHKKCGEQVNEGELLARLFSNDQSTMEEAKTKLASGYQIGDSPPEKQALIFGKVVGS